MDKIKTLLITDFTSDILKGYLSNIKSNIKLEVKKSPYLDCMSFLYNNKQIKLKTDNDLVIIWSLPNKISHSFNSKLNLQKSNVKNIKKEIDIFTDQIIKIAKKNKYVFLTNWHLPSFYKGYGLSDLQFNHGVHYILNMMNLRVSKNLNKCENVFILNSSKWIESTNSHSYSPVNWYSVKIPYFNNVFKNATDDINAYLNYLNGNIKKIIITDLDDTLWGGEVGDLGWENLRLGGHDSVGEAYQDFQRLLLNLKNNGMMLAISSKNNEKIALEAFNKNKEMILKKKDFVNWRINWDNKSGNIISMMNELNLGLDSAIFIDNSKLEREKIRNAIPEILVPDMPDDSRLYHSFISQLNCINFLEQTNEDRVKSDQYNIENKRQKLKNKILSEKDWIKKLKINIFVDTLNDKNFTRVHQLFNKTNQMNLSTRRFSKNELKKISLNKKNKFFIFSISDKFGDYGITGICCIEINKTNAILTDFVLSCRVFSRNIEESMIFTVVNFLQNNFKNKIKNLTAYLIKTKKNQVCIDFFNNYNQDIKVIKNSFIFNLNNTYKKPNYIKINNKVI